MLIATGLYGTGATIYGGHDLKNWDTTHNITLESLSYGIEETAVYALLSVPGGPPLLSAVADVGGFIHYNLDTAPAQSFHTPTYGTTHDLDYAGNSPASIVRTGELSTAIQIALSSDYGVTWNQDYGGSIGLGPGPVAYSADATAVLLLSNTGGPLISRYTSTFSAVSTLPSGTTTTIASDKRNATVFYAGAAGSFYVSTDIGVTFTKTATLGSSTVVNKVRVHPTVAGDVWASTDVGLFHSTNYGASFEQIGSGCTLGYSFALGAASTSTGYPVIYGFFTVDNVLALYKTEDAGLNWAMISDAAHGFGAASANVVGASYATYGLVFVGTNGRGTFYGVPSGTLPPVTVTGTSTIASSTTTSSSTVAMTSSTKASTTSTSTTISSTKASSTTATSSTESSTSSSTSKTSSTSTSSA